ncbi:MAG: tetratricopeptide repeat protein [bacterium]
MMNSKRLFKRLPAYYLGYALASVMLLFLMSCGASRQDSELDSDQVNIDDLLGDEENRPEDQAAEEAEVLRLLGITQRESNAVASDSEAMAAVEEQSGDLQNDVSQLKKEIQDKDQEINSLRSEIINKEARINDLQSQMKNVPKPVRSNPSIGDLADFKSSYQSALDQFNARNYQAALSQFRQLLSMDSSTSLSDNCQYWIGECYYALGNYNQAIAEFEKVFSFPNSNKSDDAQLKLGISYLKLGDRKQAASEFERLLSNYPDSEYVDLAQRYLDRLR